ncbi:hypothetical protein I4U23_019852 [Adineta vaga]|nr:hypothetical protein I4U23_019852 [Adineta vaga]
MTNYTIKNNTYTNTSDPTPTIIQTDSTASITETYSNLNDTTVTLTTELMNLPCSVISESSSQLRLNRIMQTLESSLFYNITSTFQ